MTVKKIYLILCLQFKVQVGSNLFCLALRASSFREKRWDLSYNLDKRAHCALTCARMDIAYVKKQNVSKEVFDWTLFLEQKFVLNKRKTKHQGKKNLFGQTVGEMKTWSFARELNIYLQQVLFSIHNNTWSVYTTIHDTSHVTVGYFMSLLRT